MKGKILNDVTKSHVRFSYKIILSCYFIQFFFYIFGDIFVPDPFHETDLDPGGRNEAYRDPKH